MAAFLVLLAFGMCHGFASRNDAYERWPWLALPMGTLPLLYGPVFFFYVRALTNPGLPWRHPDAHHGVPFLLGLAVYLVPGTPWSGDARLVHAIPVERWHVVLLLATAQTVAYLRRIRAMLGQYEAAVRDSCSTSDRVTLGWLRWRVRVYGSSGGWHPRAGRLRICARHRRPTGATRISNERKMRRQLDVGEIVPHLIR